MDIAGTGRIIKEDWTNDRSDTIVGMRHSAGVHRV